MKKEGGKLSGNGATFVGRQWSLDCVRERAQVYRASNAWSVTRRPPRRLFFANSLFRLLTSAAAILTIEVEMSAADQGVNLQYVPYTTPIESPAEAPFEFWDRFKVSFDQHSDELFTDRFHPLKIMDWRMELANRAPDAFRERTTSVARHTVAKSVVNGFREITVDTPIMVWLKERQRFFGDLLRNSVGNVEEDAVAPLDLSYGLVERSWWRRLSEGGSLRYGLRPFRTDPYAFLGLAIKDGESLVLLTHVRYHYRLLGDHFFEIALSLPLAHGFAIDIGTTYEFGRYGEEKRAAIKLAKELKAGGIVHVGLEAKERPMLLAGISFPL